MDNYKNNVVYIPVSNYRYKECVLGAYTDENKALSVLIDHILTYHQAELLNGLVPNTDPKYNENIGTYNNDDKEIFINTFKNTINTFDKLKEYWRVYCLSYDNNEDTTYWTINIIKCVINEKPEINYYKMVLNSDGSEGSDDSDNSDNSDDSDNEYEDDN